MSLGRAPSDLRNISLTPPLPISGNSTTLPVGVSMARRSAPFGAGSAKSQPFGKSSGTRTNAACGTLFCTFSAYLLPAMSKSGQITTRRSFSGDQIALAGCIGSTLACHHHMIGEQLGAGIGGCLPLHDQH